MLLQEAYVIQQWNGIHRNNVNQIRGSMELLSIADLAKILRVSVNNCKNVVDAIQAHPDWDDERIAEEVSWDN